MLYMSDFGFDLKEHHVSSCGFLAASEKKHIPKLNELFKWGWIGDQGDDETVELVELKRSFQG